MYAELYLGRKAVQHIFLSEFDELVQKSKLFAKKIGYDLAELHGLNYLRVENIKSFLISNTEALNSYFNEMEREDIKLYIADTGTTFNFQSILLAKPL